MTITKRLLATILNCTKSKQRNYILLCNHNWFYDSFERDLYETILNITLNDQYCDLMTITQFMRENDILKDGYIMDIMELQSKVSTNDLINIDPLFNEVYYHYSLREIHLMIQNINSELSVNDPSSNRILKEIERGHSVLTEKNVSEIDDNDIGIDNILEKHHNAKNGIPIGLDLGYTSLSKFIQLENDDVMIVGGRPAMGKTAWAISLIKNLCIDQDKKIIFFSLEMSKDRIIRRLVSLILNIDSNKIKTGNCTDKEVQNIVNLKKCRFWKNLFIIDGSQNIRNIQSYLTRLCSLHQIDCVIIDYLQKIIPQNTKSRYEEVTRISNDVKRIVMSNRIPIIALAQLNRDVARTGKRPTLPDLKESGEIEQDASIVCFLHRPEYYGITSDENGNDLTNIGEFIIAKNRDGEIGIIQMDVDLSISKWSDIDINKKIFDHYNNEDF